jgi:prenyltransferase beta subunit
MSRVVAVCALVMLPACAARAAPAARDSRFQQNLEGTVRYLQNAQREDGGFAEPGSEPDSDFTAWVALALAAAGVNPRDQTTAKQHWVGGHSAYGYLAEHAPNETSATSPTTNLERELLIVDTAGTSPHDFGGVDLVDDILKRQITTGASAGAFPYQTGSLTGEINDTAFAILALSPIHEPAVEEAIQQAGKWLESEQNCDGSWNTSAPRLLRPCNPKERRLLTEEQAGEVDMTGAAIQALDAAKRADSQGRARAFEYLHEAEAPNGGFPEFVPRETEPNVASTAWVVQALWSAGINPETWATHSGLASEEPLSYLASMQQENGHIRWEQSQEQNGILMTAEVAPAFTGNQLPIPAVHYEELPSSPPEEHPTGAGDGGVSTTPGSGVIAGGGGNGAPLFSRPQPGSKGHTPGGVRQRKDQNNNTTKHHRNPGSPRKAPVPTATSAGVLHATRHDPASHKGMGGVSLTGIGGAGQGSGREVKGILIGAPADALESDAPGLHGAGAGTDQTPWLAIAIAGALLMSALLGARIELRRGEAIL